MKEWKLLMVLIPLMPSMFLTGCGDNSASTPTTIPKTTLTPTVIPVQTATSVPTATPPAIMTNEEMQCYPPSTEYCGKIMDTPPPLCDIVPDQTTLVEAQSWLGNDGYIVTYPESVRLPSEQEAEGFWGSEENSAQLLYDSHEYVIGVSYNSCELTLEELVATYGPPTILYFATSCESGEVECSASPFDRVEFAWPEQGILAYSYKLDGLYTKDGHSLPFSPSFSIERIEYYSPFTLMDYENNENYAAGFWEKFEWSGFAVDDERD